VNLDDGINWLRWSQQFFYFKQFERSFPCSQQPTPETVLSRFNSVLIIFWWYSDSYAHASEVTMLCNFATPRTFPSALQCRLNHGQAVFFNLSREIWHSEDRASWYILIIKPKRCTNFSNLFLEQNSTCFGQVFCPSSGVKYCTHINRFMSYRLCWLLASKQLV
jgi:hypothetical protein